MEDTILRRTWAEIDLNALAHNYHAARALTGPGVKYLGVVKADAAAFFGITLHADKEILMMVVEKELRDSVLNALYKELDMSKKAKGIAFSLPVSDVAGLVQHHEKEETAKAE
mgnify:CR=1 FL=1